MLPYSANETIVTPFEKKKILGMCTEAAQIIKNGVCPPRMAVVYPSYICNHNCPDCLCGAKNKKEHSLMDPAVFPKLLNDLVGIGIKSIEFAGGGEPTLHPNFDELVELAAERKLELGLLSNGSRINAKLAALLVEHFTYVRISIDAHCDGIYKKMHHPSSRAGLSVVKRGIEMMAKLRSQTDSNIVIGAKVLASKDNMDYCKEVAELARDLGCDYCQFKALRNAEASLTDGQSEMVDSYIQRLKRDLWPFAVYGGAKPTEHKMKCWLTPIHLVVGADGSIYPCCYSLDYEELCIGNMFEKPLHVLWGSNRHKAVIKNFSNEMCSRYDCRWHYYNEILAQVCLNNKLHMNFI